ncbi:uncharacterized protein LOC116850001 [Odontomachus brunneus]|uniref:uncharacterized protein LOC116850001 n=1 Tax=Odontomachus brunneus TaxID=486640 RepID=UPI0013F255A7|nr:uncharacterized protein LOC116850001 [Odontomachus brunneus]
MCTVSWEKRTSTIVPIRLTDGKRAKHVNLLHISDPSRPQRGTFRIWIKNLSRLMSSQLSKYKVRKYICDRCRHYFHSNEKLESHITDCQKLNDCAIILPTEDNKWLSFRNYSRKERIPFIVYSDLKCTLEKTAKNGEDHKSHTNQHHKVFSIAYYLRCSYDDSLSYFRIRRDTDCISWVKQLEKLAHA